MTLKEVNGAAVVFEFAVRDAIEEVTRGIQLQRCGGTYAQLGSAGVFNADDPESLMQFLESDPTTLIARLDDRILIRSR